MVQSKLKQVLENHTLAKPEQILFKIHKDIGRDVFMPQDSNLRQQINYARRKHKVNEPTDLERVDVSNVKTIDDEEFILYKSNDMPINDYLYGIQNNTAMK